MHLLASFFLTVFTSIATWAMQFLTRRYAIVTAVVAVIIGMTVSLSLLLQAVMTGIMAGASTSFPPALVMGFSALMPTNFEVCVAAMLSVRVSVWAYRFNRDLLGMYLGGI